MPSLDATKSLLLSKTSLSNLKTNSDEIFGPGRNTLITLDMDLYCRALKLQYSVRNTYWILRPGGLHIAFAELHVLGKTIDGSGLDICTIECGTYTSAALRGIYRGKA